MRNIRFGNLEANADLYVTHIYNHVTRQTPNNIPPNTCTHHVMRRSLALTRVFAICKMLYIIHIQWTWLCCNWSIQLFRVHDFARQDVMLQKPHTQEIFLIGNVYIAVFSKSTEPILSKLSAFYPDIYSPKKESIHFYIYIFSLCVVFFYYPLPLTYQYVHSLHHACGLGYVWVCKQEEITFPIKTKFFFKYQ